MGYTFGGGVPSAFQAPAYLQPNYLQLMMQQQDSGLSASLAPPDTSGGFPRREPITKQPGTTYSITPPEIPTIPDVPVDPSLLSQGMDFLSNNAGLLAKGAGTLGELGLKGASTMGGLALDGIGALGKGAMAGINGIGSLVGGMFGGGSDEPASPTQTAAGGYSQKDTQAANQTTANTNAIKEQESGDGIGSMLGNLTGGLFGASTGTSILGDLVGQGGLALGTNLMKGITGGKESSINTAKEAADAMIQETANNKSSLLQNTNALGSQGAKAALEAQQAMNSQALSGDAIQSMNTLRNNAAKLQSNQMSLANNQMRQNQMQTAGLKDAIRSQAGGSPTAKLGNIGAIGSELAKNNAATYGQTAQALAGAGQQAAQMNAQASDVRNQDLASNFERNVKPTLNNWENFQGMATSLAGNAMQSAEARDTDTYNMFGGTANLLGARAGAQEGYAQYLKTAPGMNKMDETIRKGTNLYTGAPQ